MKKTVILLVMSLMMSHSFAQTEVKEVSQADREHVAQDLEKEADSGKHDKKTTRLLRKVAKSFKKAATDITVEIKSLDDCVNCESKQKSKGEVVVTNLGRKLGKASAWLTTTTSKPFINAAGFLTGLFEKKDKNQDIVALYKFFLNHSKEFDKLYQDAGTPEEMVELMLAKMEEIVEQKSHVILRDYLKELGITREIPADLSDFELTDDELASIDMSKVTPDFVNNHPAFQELKPIVGPVTQEELNDIILSGYFDKSIGFENYKQALPKIHEAAGALVLQVFAPKIVLGVVSKSLAGLYAVPVILADIGTAVSATICLQETTQAKFESDKDLRSFCSYVVNRSSYELVKSRAKGYVAGKNSRAKIEQKIKDRKERRAKRRAEKERQRSSQEIIEQLPVH